MKKILVLVLAAIMTVGVIGCSKQDAGTGNQATESNVKKMSGQELVDLMADDAQASNTLLVDVRKSDEFEAGHIDGAINIALEDIEANMATFESFKDKKIVLYCNTGNRSGKAAELLMKEGYAEVYNADGVKDFQYDLVTG